MSQVVLHIGDTIGILSDVHGYVTGRIIYYSPILLRVLPREFSDRAVEFPMENGGATFAPDLGVKLVELIEKQPSNYYVDVLGARPGETLEFFTVDGAEAAPSGIVDEVLKSTTKDSIKLKDGRIYKFRGIGPPEPIAVIRVVTGAPEDAAVSEQAEVAEKPIAANELMALLRQVLPVATVEIVPTAERSYPDSMQREDLFQDLMSELSEKQRTNPRRIRFIEREVDLALSLKNKSISRNTSGVILGPSPYLVSTVKDAVANASAAIPIVQAARVLNLDDANPDISHKTTDVIPRSLETVEIESNDLATRYLDGALPESMGKGFVAYTYDLLGRGQAVLQGSTPTEWAEDQEILRTADPATAVQGLSQSLPAADIPTISLAFLISSVKDRMVRVLAPSRIGNDTIAPSDPSVVTGYVIMPPKAALALRPPKRPGHLPTALLYSASLEADNLPTIAQAIFDLYSPDAGSPQNTWTLVPETDTNVAEWLSSVLQYTVHPIDSQGPRGPHLLSLLDTLGLGANDLAPATADVLWKWVQDSQNIWKNLLIERRKEIQAILDAETPRTFQGADAPLWATLKAAESLKDLYGDIARKHPTIADAPSVVTVSLLQEAQGDAAPIVWHEIMKMDARLPPDTDLATARDALAISRAYLQRQKEIRNAYLQTLKAAPEINPCEHVNRLEAIRNTTDVVQRSRLFRDFVEEYQGSRKGDWIMCSRCNRECVCYHELMELEAIAQPSRMDRIQKQILITFGGDRYEGNIVCRNCGQALQELDYDDHVEFDDSGRPIVTSSVLTEEQMESSTFVAPQIQFATQSQRDLHTTLQVIMDRGGLQIPPDVIRQIIRYADIYVNVRSPKQADYEKQRTMMMTSAAKKIKSATGLTTVTNDVITYSALQDRLRVSVLTALTAIAIQSAEPAVIVNNPAPLCKFSREGYPFQPAAKPEEEGALLYMSCVVASIERVIPPWSSVQWVGVPNPATRITMVLKSALGAIQAILGEGQPLPFTPEIRQALTRAQTDLVVKRKKAQVSLADQLPVGFRPEPFPPKMGRPVIERDPVLSKSVDTSMRQQSIAIIGELHKAASEAVAAVIAAGQHPGLEAVCCAIPLANVRELVGAPENMRLKKARDILRGSIPTAVNAGTHLWPVFEIPVPPPVEQAVDQGVYFKLFLRFCYTGPHVGEVHEFSMGNICRQCGFARGDSDKDGAQILESQQGQLRIEVTLASFHALSEAVRRRRMIQPRLEISQEPWVTGLRALAAAAKPRFAEAILGSLAVNQDLDDFGRIQLWSPLTLYMDELRNEVGERIGPLISATKNLARAQEARTALDMLDTLTEDPYVEGPRALQEYWCAKVQAASAGYTVTRVEGAIWKELSGDHVAMLNKLVSDNANWYGSSMSDGTKMILRQIAAAIGPLLRIWIKMVRPSTSPNSAWTIQEAQMILKTIILEAWRDAVTTGSSMYATIASPADRETTAAEVANWTRSLMFHVKQQYIRYSKEAIKRILQDRAGLERDTIVEEFESIKDDDLRAAELIKKQFRIGRWAGGANLQKYDAETFEFENEQRKRMGIMGPSVEPILLEGSRPQVQDYGLALDAAPEDGYDVAQGAEGDDY